MENLEITNEMITEEIQKIVNGSLNESEFLKLVHLSHKMSGIVQSSTISKQETELYISDKMDSIIWTLLQRKTVAMGEKINEIQKLERTDKEKFLAEQDNLKMLIEERNMAKAIYNQILINMSKMPKLVATSDDFEISTTAILNGLSSLSEEQQKAFWSIYFEEKRNFIFDGNARPSDKAREKFAEIYLGK